MAMSTLRKHRTFAKRLAEFAESRGHVLLDQFRSGDIDLFYASLKMGARAKGNALGTLRGFFRFCVNREWIAKNPVSADLKPPLGANRAANKLPSPMMNSNGSCARATPLNRLPGRIIEPKASGPARM